MSFCSAMFDSVLPRVLRNNGPREKKDIHVLGGFISQQDEEMVPCLCLNSVSYRDKELYWNQVLQ